MEIVICVYDKDSNPVIHDGGNTSLKIRRSSDGYMLDWNDMIFKNSGWSNLTETLDEIDDINLPGYYNKIIDLNTFENGHYLYIFNYSSPTLELFGNDVFIVNNKMEYEDSIMLNQQKMLGLLHQNIYIDNTVYDEYGNLISSRVRIYSNSADVGSEINVIGTYIVYANCNEQGKFNTWSQIEI